MPRTILYKASGPDQVYQCAYSILKYLDVYNLKPPADHSLIIYTDQPASLEMYGSLFEHFELRKDREGSTQNLIEESNKPGNKVLFLETTSYPVKALDDLFGAIGKGPVLTGDTMAVSQPGELRNFHPQEKKSGPDTSDYLRQYKGIKEFQDFLRYFFKKYQEESVPNQVKLLHHIDAKSIEEKKLHYQQLPLFTRWVKKLTGKAWSISEHTGRT